MRIAVYGNLRYFPKDVLTDRKTRLETTIRALEREWAGLVVLLEAQTLTDDQVQDILSFAAELAPGLEEAEEDVARRVLVRKLKVQAVLSKEADGRQVVDVSCVIDRGAFCVASTCLIRTKGLIVGRPERSSFFLQVSLNRDIIRGTAALQGCGCRAQ